MGFGIHKKEVWDFGISCGWDVGYVSMSQEMIYTMKVVGGFLYVLVLDFGISSFRDLGILTHLFSSL